MLDINLLNDEDDLFFGDQTILHNALVKKFPPIFIREHQVEGAIHINSTIGEIREYYASEENLQIKYEQKKSFTPDWLFALKNWIAELDTYLDEEEYGYYTKMGGYNIGTRKKHPLIYQVYSDVMNGDNKQLYHYTGFLIETWDDGTKYATLSELENIGFAVALARFLRNLKDELKILQQVDLLTPSIHVQPPKQKIKWTGTPAQFGFYMDLLIQGGYLQKPTGSFEKDSTFYLEHFDIETTKGTLTKELSENTNSIETKYRNKVVIPHKDKLSKTESMAKVSGK